MDEKLEPQQTPQTPQAPLEPLPEIDIPAVRTYKGDISNTVNQDKITTAKILMAEQRQQDKQKNVVQETSIKRPTNIFALIFGILFVVAGIGAVGYFGYTKVLKPQSTASVAPASFFLFAFDDEAVVDTGRSRNEVFSSVNEIVLRAASNKDNTYIDVVFTETNRETEVISRISSVELFDLYEIRLPLAVEGAISRDFTYGLYKTGTRVEPFLVVGLTDAQAAYDAMFDWERTMALDLQEFFPNLKRYVSFSTIVPDMTDETVGTTTLPVSTSTPVEETATATTTASSTPEQTQPPVDRSVQFVDVVLSNRDTRAIRDSNGTPVFFYTFIEQNKILFAQEPALISEIVRKIKEKQLVR